MSSPSAAPPRSTAWAAPPGDDLGTRAGLQLQPGDRHLHGADGRRQLAGQRRRRASCRADSPWLGTSSTSSVASTPIGAAVVTAQIWQFDPTAAVGSKWLARAGSPGGARLCAGGHHRRNNLHRRRLELDPRRALIDTADSFKYDPVANTWTADHEHTESDRGNARGRDEWQDVGSGWRPSGAKPDLTRWTSTIQSPTPGAWVCPLMRGPAQLPGR